MWTSAPSFDLPANGRDDAMHWSVAQNSSSAAWASLYLRDALDLRNVRQLSIVVQAWTPTAHPVPITVTVLQEWGHTATLGTVVADGTPRTVTFAVPAAVRGFDNNVRLTIANTALTALSTAPSQRRAYVSVYGLTAVV